MTYKMEETVKEESLYQTNLEGNCVVVSEVYERSPRKALIDPDYCRITFIIRNLTITTGDVCMHAVEEITSTSKQYLDLSTLIKIEVNYMTN